MLSCTLISLCHPESQIDLPAISIYPPRRREWGVGKAGRRNGFKIIIFFYPLVNCCCLSQSERTGTFSYIFHGPPLYFRKLHLGATDGNVEAVGGGRLRLSQKGKVKTMFQKHTSQQRDDTKGPSTSEPPTSKL